MAAIITEPLKRQMLDHLYDEINTGFKARGGTWANAGYADSSNTAKYYVGVGKARQWNGADVASTPENSLKDERDLRFSLQAIKATTDVSFVIPRYNWTSGTTYSGYDDDQSGIGSNSFYVITEDNAVFICLRQGKSATGSANTSTEKPHSVGNPKPFKTSDGYVWKYLYTVSATRASKYLSANYLPVAHFDSSNMGSDIYAQEQVRFKNDYTQAGRITDIVVTNGGTGYTSTPTITIDGDGSGATATAVVSGNSVVKIELDSSADSCIKMGMNYDRVGITISGGSGSGALARAVLARDSGIGANPIKDLKSTSLMINAKPAGAEGTDFIIDQDFRQVALIKNPHVDSAAEAALYTGTTGGVNRYLSISAVSAISDMTAQSLKDKLITGSTSGAKAWCDWFDSDASRILGNPAATGRGGARVYIHQNDSSGFKSFTSRISPSSTKFNFLKSISFKLKSIILFLVCPIIKFSTLYFILNFINFMNKSIY